MGYYDRKRNISTFDNLYQANQENFIEISNNLTNLEATIQKYREDQKVLSKNIADASFYEIIRQLQYKSKFKGKYFYQIDTYYPSSQTCSVCSHIDKKYKNLNERMYYCTNCHNELDRDLNASINIMFEGLKLHMKYNFS